MSTPLANRMLEADPPHPAPSAAEAAAQVAEPGIENQERGRFTEWLMRTAVPWCIRADGVETRIPMRFVGMSSRPSEGLAMASRAPFNGSHAVIGRNPTGFPVGAWAGGSQPNRLVFRRIPEAWDAGSEHG